MLGKFRAAVQAVRWLLRVRRCSAERFYVAAAASFLESSLSGEPLAFARYTDAETRVSSLGLWRVLGAPNQPWGRKTWAGGAGDVHCNSSSDSD